MLSPEHAQHLRNLEPRMLDGSMSPGFEMIMNNCRSEDMLKPEDKRRSENTLRTHVAQGIGFEKYLSEGAPFLIDVNEIVDDARKKIKYKDRMRDFQYEDQFVQVKTTRKLYGSTVYFSESTTRSIKGSVKHNSFFIVGLAVPYRDDLTLFTYKPAFAADAAFLARALRTPNDQGGYVDLSGCSKHPSEFQPLCEALMEV